MFGYVVVDPFAVDLQSNLWQLMNGRWFDERQLEAHISTGTEKFKKSSDRNLGDDEAEDEEGGRLDRFGSWLEQEG